MTSDKEILHGKLTGVFGKYVENELKESPNKQIKMSEFFKHIDKNYSTEKFDSYIVIGNTNIKSIYFDEHNRNNLDFEIYNSKDLEIIVNEKHKIAKLSMLHCKNIELIFVLENGTNGFIHQNNCSFFECEFKTIAITPLSGYQDKFVFNYKLNFENTTFKEPIVFNNKIFNNKIIFRSCTFEKEVYFSNSVFKEVALYSVFRDNVYFNNSKFDGVFIFERSKFEKEVDFLKTEFNNFFDLSSCSFQKAETINFSSLKINTNTKTLERNINKLSKQEIEKTHEEYETAIKEQKIIFTKGLRDSFAFIKHNFIQRNNLIEAQKYKIAEFYAEELRFKYECEIIKKGCLGSFRTFPKATINFLQLLFYRHTSNHHTDLLKSFNTMLLLIGLFGLFTGAIILSFNCCYVDTFTTSVHSNIELYNTHIKHYIIAHESRLIFINFSITFGFLLIFFILCICFQNKISRFIVVSLSYLCSILLLLFSPKSIISITNLFSGNQHILDPLSALSGIYTILFILLIYSLQKTSRRNSIM